VLGRRVYACLSRGPGDAAHLSVHVPVKALGGGAGADAVTGEPVDVRGLTERLASARHGGLDGLAALDEAAIAAGGRWQITVLGIGLGAAPKLNVYVAPVGPPRRGRPYSYSGWIGSRVGV
jgi:hypothetical protein